MKNIKYIKFSYLLGLILFFSSCSVDENPQFVGSDVLFADTENSQTVLDGIYNSSIGYWYYASGWLHVTNYTSGMVNGQRPSDLANSAALLPKANDNDLSKSWAAMYEVIYRANNFIGVMRSVELDNVEDQNDQLGQALFLRAHTYFNLVRMFGEVPMLLETPTSTNMNFPKASKTEIMDQIIADLDEAETLLKGDDMGGSQMIGRPVKFAANMVKAQVYMYLAGNKTAGETDNWQKAYDEAIKVYGRYTLEPDFRSLWHPATSNFTSEAIFELQGNVENTFRIVQLHVPNKTLVANTWGRFKANCEVYMEHANAYGGGGSDPRFGATYITEWTDKNNKNRKTFSLTNLKQKRGNNYSFPFTYKFWGKGEEATALTFATNRNWVVLRYAHLLIMLAEIENELNGPAGAYTYINEVLARARNSADAPSAEPADWSGMTQDEFRQAIMLEYQFELYTEGHDFFYNRRRGIEYFTEHVIEKHNNFEYYDFTKKFDQKFPEPGTTEANRLILLPIPASELLGNPNVNEQNTDY